MLRERACCVVWAVGLVVLWSSSFAGRAAGQDPLASPLLQGEAREKAYQQLFRDVAELERQSNILKTVVKLVSPTVVHIEAKRTEGSRSYGRSRTIEEAGSGAIIELSKQMYVITNRHVIRDAPLGNVDIGLIDGRRIHPTRVWTDKDSDVAVMLVEAANLIPARIGDSDKVEIGDFAVAVGSPFGLSHSVTYGIISAKGRRDLELGDGAVRFQDFIQTDASINPGNSGGPLINMRGEIVGINTAIASESGSNSGVGFAIPINMAMAIVHQLVERGAVARAFLGVTLDSKFTTDVATQLGMPRRVGAHVIRVTPGSPAEQAHLEVGDVILQFNGVPIADDGQLVNVISLTKIGSEVPVIVFRKGQTVTMKTTVGDYDQFLKATEPRQ
jgi:serine protease Do